MHRQHRELFAQERPTRQRRLLASSLAIALAITTLPTLAGLPGGPQPAKASKWFWGTGFRIGNIHFEIGHRPHRHPGDYYYRTKHRVRSRYKCTDRCYVQRGSHYHDQYCPVIRDHFRRNGHYYRDVFSRYRPPHRDNRYYDRHQRSYRDYDYYDDRRPRRSWYRPHRHYHYGRYCPWY